MSTVYGRCNARCIAYNITPPGKHAIKQVEELGLAKPGSKRAFALAMLLNTGASQADIRKVVGYTLWNPVTRLTQQGVVRKVPMYKLELVQAA